MKMPKKLKEEWIKALRSGEYEQGKKRLRTLYRDGSEKFCCLGVLCDIGIDGVWDDDTCIMPAERHAYDDHSIGVPSQADLIAMGIGDPFDGTYFYLAEMNDEANSFDEIADWIEDNIEEIEE